MLNNEEATCQSERATVALPFRKVNPLFVHTLCISAVNSYLCLVQPPSFTRMQGVHVAPQILQISAFVCICSKLFFYDFFFIPLPSRREELTCRQEETITERGDKNQTEKGMRDM